MKDEISEIARWECDKCGSKFDGSEEAKSCRGCDYDVCVECCEKWLKLGFKKWSKKFDKKLKL